jgi:hypothetical protein
VLDVTNLGFSLTTIAYLVVTFLGGLVAALLGMRVKK